MQQSDYLIMKCAAAADLDLDPSVMSCEDPKFYLFHEVILDHF